MSAADAYSQDLHTASGAPHILTARETRSM